MNPHHPTQPDQAAGNDDRLVAVPMPALIAVLIHLEREKGAAMTETELLAARDNAVSMMLPLSQRRALDQSRGYRDIDPDNLWQEWCAHKAGADPFTLTS